MTIADGVCFFQHVMKNAFSLQMILFLDAINFTRYVFIFWHKNPAIFLDAFWSFFINTWVICFSLLSQSVYAYLPGSILYINSLHIERSCSFLTFHLIGRAIFYR
jgi:hypothetical protein